MPGTKVLVQGISHTVQRTSSQYFADDKSHLEQLMGAYGPVRCTYWWICPLDELTRTGERNFERISLDPGTRETSSFAHLVFDNKNDAERACKAADEHQIIFKDSILALTMWREDLPSPIRRLSKRCLLKIFGYIRIDQKLIAEMVCKRWKRFFAHIWAKLRILDLTTRKHNPATIEWYLRKFGKYIRDLHCPVYSLDILRAIELYCDATRVIRLFVPPHVLSDLDVNYGLIQLFRKCPNMHMFSLNYPDSYFRMEFVQHLPGNLLQLILSSDDFPEQTYHFRNISRFHHLRSLILNGFTLMAHLLEGFESLPHLQHLDFDRSTTYRSLTNILPKCTMLEMLKIPRSGLTDDTFADIILNCRRLEYLDISVAPSVTDSSLQLLPRLQNLTTLQLSRNSVNLEFMSEMPSLENLECEECMNLSDAGLANFIKLLPNLSDLNILYSSITPEFFFLVNEVLKERDMDIVLEIVTNLPFDIRTIVDRSPLLAIEFCPYRRFSVWTVDGSMDNVNYLNDIDPPDDVEEGAIIRYDDNDDEEIMVAQAPEIYMGMDIDNSD